MLVYNLNNNKNQTIFKVLTAPNMKVAVTGVLRRVVQQILDDVSEGFIVSTITAMTHVPVDGGGKLLKRQSVSAKLRAATLLKTDKK